MRGLCPWCRAAHHQHKGSSSSSSSSSMCCQQQPAMCWHNPHQHKREQQPAAGFCELAWSSESGADAANTMD
jgi:hypothetical protein